MKKETLVVTLGIIALLTITGVSIYRTMPQAPKEYSCEELLGVVPETATMIGFFIDPRCNGAGIVNFIVEAPAVLGKKSYWIKPLEFDKFIKKLPDWRWDMEKENGTLFIWGKSPVSEVISPNGRVME